MYRFILVLVVVVGISYGGWSLIRSDTPAAPLSSTESPSPQAKEAAAPPPEKPAPAESAPAPDTAVKPSAGESLAKLLKKAESELATAKSARTRAVALAGKDRARRLLSEALMVAPAERAEEIGSAWTA